MQKIDDQAAFQAVNSCPLCSRSGQEFKFNDWQGNRYVKCNDCGLFFQNPRKVTEYEDNYWCTNVDPDGKIRKLYEEKDYMVKNLYGHVLKFIKRLDFGKVLDAGCGYGFFLSALGKGWDKYGIEYSNFLVERLKNGRERINIRQGRLEDRHFDDGLFDLIFCSDVMEHVADPLTIIKRFYSYLKKDGILIITTPNIASLCARRFKGNFRLLGTPHIIMFSEAIMKKLLKDSGFKIIKTEHPFLKTEYFTFVNLLRLLDRRKISPPFYGNIMTIYARKK